jgi:6-phosphogluconate dehydrogenase
MVGLGRMGANMARRLMRGGHECVVYDRNPATVRAFEKDGAQGAGSLAELATILSAPRAAWLMLPAGDVTEQFVHALAEHFAAGDIIVDGGNSFFKDDMQRAATRAARGIHYLDVGTSGGVWGLERGYCLMIGGAKSAVERLDPVFRVLAPGPGDIPRTPGRSGPPDSVEHGYLHCGPAGAGHLVKMVHNGIEYGMMQAYAEGFELLKRAPGYELDAAAIAEVWRRGSVVTSWLLDLSAAALVQDPDLDHYTGRVQDSGEGRWTVQTAVEAGVPAHVLSAALYARFRSRQDGTFADKLLSAMRHGFGGHTEPPAGKP